MTRQEVLDLCIRVACDLNCERDRAWMEGRDDDYDRFHAMSWGACEVFDAITAAWVPTGMSTATHLPPIMLPLPAAELCEHDARTMFHEAKVLQRNAVSARGGMADTPYAAPFWNELATAALRCAIRVRDRALPERWRREET